MQGYRVTAGRSEKRPPSCKKSKHMETTSPVTKPLVDFEPDADNFREEVLAGLAQKPQKTLPCKFLYDERGSQLFDQICKLKEYYPTRTEIAIMEQNIEEIAGKIGPRALLVEYGSGSSIKTRILLNHLPRVAAYVPVDISREHLLRSVRDLSTEYDELAIYPVCADYTGAFTLPDVEAPVARRVVYFPGSTLGNMEPPAAQSFLKSIASRVGPGGGLLIGVDLKKDRQVLEAAYNDSEGVTAAFNKNMLRRINRELGANFDLDQFAHRATYNAEAGRIESYLVSQAEQSVQLNGTEITFKEQETIHTENSYKYGLEEFEELAREIGFRVEKVWTDADNYFSVHYLSAS